MWNWWRWFDVSRVEWDSLIHPSGIGERIRRWQRNLPSLYKKGTPDRKLARVRGYIVFFPPFYCSTLKPIQRVKKLAPCNVCVAFPRVFTFWVSVWSVKASKRMLQYIRWSLLEIVWKSPSALMRHPLMKPLYPWWDWATTYFQSHLAFAISQSLLMFGVITFPVGSTRDVKKKIIPDSWIWQVNM